MTATFSEGYEVTDRGGAVVEVELCYPRSARVNEVEVGLSDVRAADSVRITYDFDRDGWSIKQASRFSWTGDEPRDSGWQEVAFVQAWARKVGDDT